MAKVIAYEREFGVSAVSQTAPPSQNEKPKREPAIKDISAYELGKLPLTEPKWYVEGLIAEGLTLLAGDGKIGKSLFALNIACAIASGGIALSSIPVQSRKVAYMALEDTDKVLVPRLEKFCPDGLPETLRIIKREHLPHPFYLNPPGIKHVNEYLDNTGVDFLVVDTLHHVKPPALMKGTAYDNDYAVMKPMQELAHDRDMGILMVTHAKKTKGTDPFMDIQGSAGMQAACDNMLVMARENGNVYLHVRGREIQQEEHGLEMDDGIWKIQSGAEFISAPQNEVSLLIRDADDGMTPTEIAAATKRSRQAISGILQRLAKDGKVFQKEKRGRWFYRKDI